MAQINNELTWLESQWELFFFGFVQQGHLVSAMDAEQALP